MKPFFVLEKNMNLSPTMKKLILLLGVIVCLMASLNLSYAQKDEGVITYEVKTDMHRRIPKEREAIKAMIPQFRTDKQQLFFNTNESLYKKLEEDSEEDMESTSHGGGVQIKMNQPNIVIHFASNTQQRTTQQEFMGKDYLIVDTLKVLPWKFGTETKMVAGYQCKQAYYTDESRPDQKTEVTAWYTDEIRPFLGPEKYHSLPGTILAVDMNNGERVYIAKSIEFKKLGKKDLKIPSSGTPISQAAFRKMVDEQMKKMGASGGVMIRTN